MGPASTVHIAFELLKRKADVDMTFVPYPGPPPAVSALLGDHVTSIFVPYPAVEAQLKTGLLRALATSSRTRIEALPVRADRGRVRLPRLPDGRVVRGCRAGEDA